MEGPKMVASNGLPSVAANISLSSSVCRYYKLALAYDLADLTARDEEQRQLLVGICG